VVCGVVLERLDLAVFGYRFWIAGAAAMELAEKAERVGWKMN
jgi:hypothetical protein